MEPQDDFDSAFAEATDTTADTQQPVATDAPDGEATSTPASTEPTTPAEPVAASEPAVTPDAQAAALEAAAAAPKDPLGTAPAAAPAATAPTPEPTPAPAQQNLDPKFLAQAIAEAQAITDKSKQNPAAAPAPAKALTSDDFLSAEDKAAIATFKSEWPTESVAIDKMYNARLQAELGNYKAQLLTELNGVLAPVFQSLGTVQATSHMGAITAAHPDAETIAPAVVEWAKTQPSYLQAAMMTVLEKGSAPQIVELLNDYKKTLVTPGAAPVTPAPAAENQGTPPKKGVDPAAVAALAAVPAAQRPTPAARPSDNDFDAAFDEALAQA